MPLDALGPDGEKMAGERKDYFEVMRERVPRYLFRAFDESSGGGPERSIINATEIIPRGFMNGRQVTGFYEKPEKQLHAMAHAHFLADQDVLTEFSSWAASLHTVLCYAYTCSLEYGDVHVAVLDREKLDGEVRIWWVPHLLDPEEHRSEHEYLAHGFIRGPGYAAVPFKNLMVGGLCPTVFPELSDWGTGKIPDFGDGLRYKMFNDELVGYYDYQTERIRHIGSLFGDLALPVMLALLTLRPRYLAQASVPVNDAPMAHSDFVDWLITALDIQTLEFDPGEEDWCQPGWIKLLCMIGEWQSQQSVEEEKGGGSDIKEDSGVDDRTMQDQVTEFELQDLDEEDSDEEMSDEELDDESDEED